MKFMHIMAPLLFAGVATAEQIQSKPFHLLVRSKHRSLHNQKLAACHSGAATQSLCLTGDTGSMFYLNRTEGSQSPVKNLQPAGKLIWNLPIQNGPVSLSMSFHVEPSSNVALPLFEPSDISQLVAFDKKDRLAILSYLDDTQKPPKSEALVLKNWYACMTYYSGYRYQTLSWALGSKKIKPENPSCKKVKVERRFLL
ncbi:hypothetical protein DCS_01692 [Drechmeria coniospora]|uniref:DUF7907 domain-containing protein n=1 Tax=Drechmeria coniospora TaxID=98403 RepID=A0A151GTX1_DRECN|nr:hypothetical protein DCS_01692 [Drechmeria coniospora]KYK60555.1 hypothetical protein DCS_01692 [Drechmeria coniospora]ODA80711.1 hypothetical protein RJ55_03670 [Drechmeria coniospora]